MKWSFGGVYGVGLSDYRLSLSNLPTLEDRFYAPDDPWSISLIIVKLTFGALILPCQAASLGEPGYISAELTLLRELILLRE